MQSYKLIFLDEMKFILDSRQARSANSLARLLERVERGKGKRGIGGGEPREEGEPRWVNRAVSYDLD